MKNLKSYPLFLEPTVKNYVWGGKKFKNFTKDNNDSDKPIAEIWAIYEENKILNGSLAGKTLKEVVNLHGELILGKNAQTTSNRFPLLIKLLDSQQWLSIQVHPNDHQAFELEGPAFNGKTEGWYVLSAESGAQLIAGVKPDVSKEEITQAIQTGLVTSYLQYHPIKKDDYIFIPAGTIHALGPGAVIYEIQQNSDVTYRVYDWDRPLSAGRQLHIEKSIAVTDLNHEIRLQHAKNGMSKNIFDCEYFSLDLYKSNDHSLEFNPNGESFHAITVIEGNASLSSETEQFQIHQFESVLVPADYKTFHLSGEFKLLIGKLNKL